MSSTLCLASLPLFLSLAVAAPASIWRISILESPAPPPDEGPPLSATAIRDKSKLKYEIIGIFAAYVIWVLISLFLIFFVGKRLRRKAQTSNRTLSMEMLKTANAQAYPIPPGPKSPGKIASLKSWATGGKHNYKHSDVTVSSIDEKIIDSDKQRNMDQMTNIYAAVMAHDEERSQKTRNSNRTSPTSPRSPIHPENSTQAAQAMPTPPISPQYPPEFQHLRSAVAQAQTAHQALHHPMPPAPAEDHSTSTSRASTKKGTPLSFISGKHDKSGSSNSIRPRPGHISVRGMPISQPMGSADLTQSSQYSEDMPLSPRLYNPGPPPPTPGQQKSTAVSSQTHEIEGPRRRTPAELSLSGRTAANSSTNSLPFRDMYASSQDGLRTAPPTKTTFVNTRESMMVHPKTGVPATPYSPYTPFTPMTPVTPRLMTKKEMKKRRKEDGMGVLSEDDMVRSDDDMWGV